MSRVLGQDPTTRPVSPDGTWVGAKAFWFQVLGYKLYCDQVKRFHESDARIRIIEAPARGAKSYTAAHDAVVFAMPVRPMADALIWSIGPTFKVNKEFDYLYEIFVERREELKANGISYEIERAVNRPTAGDMEIRFVKDKDPKTGRLYRSRILGLSAENEKVAQGEEVSYAILSEAAEQDESILTKYVEQRCNHIVMPTTPKPKAKWLRKLGEDGRVTPEMRVETFRFPPEANPTYDWSRFRAAKAAAEIRAREQYGPDATASDDPYFAEQFEGRWVYYEGRVLPFSRRRHLVAPGTFGSLREHRIAVSVDYGYQDPAVALFFSILDGPVYFLFDEIHERHLTSERFVEAILARLSHHGLEADFFVGDPKKPEVDRVMQDLGLPIFAMDKKAQASREAGYRRLIDTLTQGPFAGFPGLYVSSRCEKTAAEWDELHFKDGFSKEYSEQAIAGKGNDNAADAARYFLMTRPLAKAIPASSVHPVDAFLRMRRAEQARSARSLFHYQIGARRYAA